VLATVRRIHELLALHFPASGPGRNELDDRPIVL
jgi:uncharacterized membrane protein